VLGGLLALVVATAALTILGLLAWPVQLVADLALLGWLRHLRVEARRSTAVARRRDRLARRAAAAGVWGAAPDARPAAARAGETPAAAPRDRDAGSLGHDTAVGEDLGVEAGSVAGTVLAEEAEQLAATGTDEPHAHQAAGVMPDVPAAARRDDGVWEPMPVPPPAYTLKPPAPRRTARRTPSTRPAEPDTDRSGVADAVDAGLSAEASPASAGAAAGTAPDALPLAAARRSGAEPATIDLTALGLWTDERDVRASLFRADDSDVSDDEPEIDELLEQRRAVGS
jgi:hypothetical protein